MPIPKHYPIKPDEYHRIHSRIRRQLAQKAFNAYYKCERCGAHKDLEIHIPNPDPKLEKQPGFFTVLCQRCHRLV